jgi:hypothetical protein
MTPELRAVVELFVDERVPCNYVVVPAFMEPETADYLRAKRSAHPGLVEINQHGFLHEQVLRGRHRYSEFGGDRPLSEQKAAIEEGRRILEHYFGDDLGPAIFTPPANRFDEKTLQAMSELGFSILSGLVKTRVHRRAVYAVGYVLGRTHLFGTPISYHQGVVPRHGLLELSTAIDVDMDTNLFGHTRVKGVDDLMEEFERARRVQSVVGVMIHHAAYTSAAKLDTLRGFFRALRATGDVELESIEQIARALGWRDPRRAAA